MNPPEYILYGLPHSLYSGIVRCYLRTQGLAYQERTTAHPDFLQKVVPVVGRRMIPVLETPEGELIQDSLDIVTFLDATGVPYPAFPASPLQQVIAVLIFYYGSQVLLRPAMHYRWSYREQQEGFLQDAFCAATGSDQKGREAARAIMARMQSYLPRLGVTPATSHTLENNYTRLLQVLEKHLQNYPYLLGFQPCLADYGLIGPLFAHLGRDPVPSELMKTQAPQVYRWVERMTAPGLDRPEYPDSEGLLKGGQLPESLEPLLQLMAEEAFPELTDKLAFLDAWINQQQPQDGDQINYPPQQRHLGLVETHYCGHPIQVGVAPYFLYILNFAEESLAKCSASQRQEIIDYLTRQGLDKALPGFRGYRVARKNNREIWQVQGSLD
ncbi:glutathione S-transferase family protein [Marinospirillum sp.]|uniref:glutathione S-transferase family protein n=1 Tax=Marinospirillum sp. TaxID=2183934 RepID=UPI00286FB82F|nr:glutathione S-transferase family protein [Marinospirillum sp.]MDR9467886.1 glutathione S-transferase family protein [Marinospirillum sp.]